MSRIIPGTIVVRADIPYLVVRDYRRQYSGFTAKPRYSIIDLVTYEVYNLEVALDSLNDICRRAKLIKIADSFEEYIKIINGDVNV